jgi:tellurite resistance protein TerC
MRLFHYLPYGLSLILVFVGIKMLLVDIYKIPIGIALGTVAGLLALSVIASIIFPPKTEGTTSDINQEGSATHPDHHPAQDP